MNKDPIDYSVYGAMATSKIHSNSFLKKGEEQMNKDHIDYSVYGAMAMSYNSIIIKYAIKKIIVNNDAVIVFFKDGEKTVVKKMDSDADDIYSAVAQAVMKKMYGSTNAFHKFVDKLYEKR